MTVEYDIGNVCFICGCTKVMFHTSRESFSVHTKRTHHLWNYIYYLVMLIEKPKESLTGPEATILDKYLRKDMSWFPLHRTRQLTERQDEEQNPSHRLDLINKKLDYVTNSFYASKLTGDVPAASQAVNPSSMTSPW